MEGLKDFARKLFDKGYVVIPMVFEKGKGKDTKKPLLSDCINHSYSQFKVEHRRMTEIEFKSLPFDHADGLAVVCDIAGSSGKFLYGLDLDFQPDFTKLPVDMQDCYREQTHSGNWRIPFFTTVPVKTDRSTYENFELLADGGIMLLYDPKILEAENVLSGVLDPEKKFKEVAQALSIPVKHSAYTTDDLETRLLTGVPEGERDNTCFALAIELRDAGKTKEVAVILLENWNLKNTPPLDRKVITEKVKSAYSRPRRKGRFMCLADLTDFIGRDIMDRFKFKTFEEDGGHADVWYYHEATGIWKSRAVTLIETETNKLCDALGIPPTNSIRTEVFGLIRSSSHTDRVKFVSPLNLICVANGVLDIKTSELLAFSAEYNFTNNIPVDFDPKADCPKIIKFLNEVVAPTDVDMMLQLMGYCLYRSYEIASIFILYGKGRNGKSTFVQMFKNFLGYDNYSNIDLNSLCSNRFSQSDLYGKLANLNTEVARQNSITYIDVLKKFSGNDPIQADRKFLGKIKFVNYAKLIFACNEFPMLTDYSDAMNYRLQIIDFPNQFLPEKGNMRNMEEILTDLTTEYSGLLNVILKALHDLMSNKTFRLNITMEEHIAKNELRMRPYQYFVNNYVVNDPSGYITKADLYSGYKIFAARTGHPIVSDRVFYTQLGKLENISLNESRKNINGNRVYVLLGISWNNKALDEFKLDNHTGEIAYESNAENATKIEGWLSEKDNE